MDLSVRPVEPDDVPRLEGVEAAADRLLAERFDSDLFTATPGERRLLDRGFVLVAGRPCVGFAQVLEEPHEHSAHLQQVAVDPASGRRGLGTALVEAVCVQAAARGYDALTLTTYRDVPYNAPWYARLGFEVVDEPAGVLARHLREEAAYAALEPRVGMRRALRAGTG